MRPALFCLLALSLACEGQQRGNNHKQRDQACARNLDCAYGLECAEPVSGTVAIASQPDGGAVQMASDAGTAQPADAGAALSGSGKTCQFKSFADCDGEGPGANGQPQCLSGQKCRDGHCTVMCAGPKDCREGEVCKIGVCQRGGRSSASCYDNRDCPWPETCFYGQCVTRTEAHRCQTDLDCGPGLRCINGLCQ